VQQTDGTSRASIVNIGRDGTSALRLHTEPGDSIVTGTASAERADVMINQAMTDCFQGREQWWEHSLLFPDDYNAPPAGQWHIVFDFHNTGTGQANFHVDASRYDGGTLWLRGYGGIKDQGEYKAKIGPIVKNQWYDFVYHVKWSSGSDGFMKAWVNGAQVLDHSGPTLYVNQGCYLKLANYHTPWGQPVSVIHDRIIRYDVGR